MMSLLKELLKPLGKTTPFQVQPPPQGMPDLDEFLTEKDGFCHPDWAGIGERLSQSLRQEDEHAGWVWASRCWLEKLQQSLGLEYHLLESQNFQLLYPGTPKLQGYRLRELEGALDQILDRLDGVALDEGLGKHVALIFPDQELYYQYISYFYPEGDYSQSGGLCIRAGGFVHFALIEDPVYSSYSTLVHELTHDCLSHLAIPLWLDEALAIRMQLSLCGGEEHVLDREMKEKHLAFWNAERIQEFWSGSSWQRQDEGCELSYSLAMILWGKIEVLFSKDVSRILSFVREASVEDAGESACQQQFDFSLADLVMDFLGEGDWGIQPERRSEPFHGEEETPGARNDLESL